MEIEIKGSTNNIKNKDEALNFARAAARICYSKHDFDTLVKEEDTNDLIGMTLKSGHHSPYDHINLSIYLKEIPKFGAMILNNERPYTTSEKSARYTQMETHGLEKKLYDKWKQIFYDQIYATYSQLDLGKIEKLAMENARYVTSVFTPTKMLYTVSFRQLNYIMHWFENYIETKENSHFNVKIKEFMRDFNKQLMPFYDERLNPEMKKRTLSIFANRKNFEKEFGENYSTMYEISMAGFAQAHRHRTLNYEIIDVEDDKFFIPPIIRVSPLQENWISDLKSVKENYPQATLIKIHEYGNHKDFISKMNERLCGHAQWEMMNRTRKTLDQYIKNSMANEVVAILSEYNEGPRCSFPDTKCNSEPCWFWHGKYGPLQRLI